MSRTELVALTLLSGVAGLSYEVLYARLISQYFGEVFYVQGAVLATVLIGIGVGARLTPLLRERLWQVELFMGAYAIAVAAGHALLFESIAAHLLEMTSSGAALTIAMTFAVLAPPALAIGLCVPLFAETLASDAAYQRAYGFYNLGAAASVLLVEFFVLRRLGLTATLVVFAGLDLLIAWRLRTTRTTPPPRPRDQAAGRGPLLVLLAAGVCASVYQLFALRQIQVFWGPFQENFALHVFATIFAIGVASVFLTRVRIRFGTWLAIVAVVLPLVLTLPTVLMPLYPTAVEDAVGPARLAVALCFFAVLYLPGLLLIGGVLPAYYNEYPGGSWRALSLNSLGNATGFVVYLTVLHPGLDALSVAVAVGLGFFALALTQARRLAALICVGSLAVLASTFDAKLHRLCFRDFYSQEEFEAATAPPRRTETIRVYGDTLVYRETAQGQQTATLNGHRTLWVSERRGNLGELLHGVLPLAYVSDRRSALALGLGTGISAGALAETFGKVTAVELSPAVLAAVGYFSRHNFGVAHRADVDLQLADGLTYLYGTDETFDLILSTVDGPFYQASSKLYSREFFALARGRLRPGGVYAFWIEQSYRPEVIDIIFTTLRSAFDECHVAVLNGGYFQILCGDRMHWTAPTQQMLTPALTAAIENYVPVHEFLRAAPSLYFERSRLTMGELRGDINTLDRPVLEFAKTLHTRSTERLATVVGLDVAARCADLQALFGALESCRE